MADRDTAVLVRTGAVEEEDRNPGIGATEADEEEDRDLLAAVVEEVTDCDKSRNVMPVDTVTRMAEYNRIPIVQGRIRRALFCIVA